MASVPFTKINLTMKEKVHRRKLGGQIFYQPVICARTALVNLYFRAVDKGGSLMCLVACSHF